MKKILLSTLIFISPFLILAQGITDFDWFGEFYTDNLNLGIAYTQMQTSNTEAPHPSGHESSFGVLGVDMRSVSYDKGATRWFMQYKALGDMLLVLQSQSSGNKSLYARHEGSSVTGGLIGWHSIAWNAIVADKICIAGGFNVNDYVLDNNFATDSGLYSPEPQGYHLAVGPNVMIDVAITNFLLLQTNLTYSVSVVNMIDLEYANPDKKYPLPHFGGLNVELLTPWGLFVSYDYNFLINRGNVPGNPKRWDFNLGFRMLL